MPIVTNLARPGDPVDKSFSQWNRKNAGPPGGSVVPQYAGEIVLDTTGNVYWRAEGLANTDWVAMTPRV